MTRSVGALSIGSLIISAPTIAPASGSGEHCHTYKLPFHIVQRSRSEARCFERVLWNALLELAWFGLAIAINVVGEIGFARHADWQAVLYDKLDDRHCRRRRFGLSVLAVIPHR